MTCPVPPTRRLIRQYFARTERRALNAEGERGEGWESEKERKAEFDVLGHSTSSIV